MVSRQACRNNVVDRATHAGHGITAGAALGPLVNRGARAELEFIARLFAVQQHGATGDVASEQGALRSAQYFNAFQVKGVKQDAVVEPDVNAVDHNAHSGVDAGNGAVHTQAANGEVCRTTRRTHVIQRHVGQPHREVGEVANFQCIELVCTESGDRQRYFLRSFFTLACGDNHFFQQRRGAAPDFLLCLGGGGKGSRHHGAQ